MVPLRPLWVALGLGLGAPHALAQSCNPCRIWPVTTVPGTAAAPDAQPVELGVKFKSDVAGKITAIQFYRGLGNDGPHSGHLWTLGGTLLASVTFAAPTQVGWQTAFFAQPVSIVANTIYVASYFTPQGRYAYTNAYFGGGGVDAPPLRALANATEVNGVYAYAATSSFPNQTFQASNYWVDVLFEPNQTINNDHHALPNAPPEKTPANAPQGRSNVLRRNNSNTNPRRAKALAASDFQVG